VPSYGMAADALSARVNMALQEQLQSVVVYTLKVEYAGSRLILS